MLKIRILSLFLVLSAFLMGWFIYTTETNEESNYQFRKGLDLAGGTHLTYLADTSDMENNEVAGAMDTLRQTIERRINIFGVSEPVVQVERGGFLTGEGTENRLIIELPGVTDIEEAIDMIGQTPLLEFKVLTQDLEIIEAYENATSTEERNVLQEQLYVRTGLTGSQLSRASVSFDQFNRPMVSIRFNSEGRDLLREITENNLGQAMPIFLDGFMISNPFIRDVIYGGEAQISGDFSLEEVRELVQNLNFGALPIPISLLETQTIGASLGEETFNQGVTALIWGLILISIFLIAFYRLPGLIASLSLILYLLIMMSLFKVIPVTLTASGLAGFILSIGMAVDANILIFERLKEELKSGSNTREAILESTKRAWSSIRDGNLSSLIAAAVLFWMSGTSLIKGFALVFGIGVLVSMFTAIFISKTFLLLFSSEKPSPILEKLFGASLIDNK